MAWYPARGGGIPASVKTDMNAVLNKKFGTSAQTYPPREWADDVNLMGLLPIRTASGTIAHFEDGADDVPCVSVVANIVPIQEGTGDPSHSNVRPITGHSSVNVEQTGKNLFDDSNITEDAFFRDDGTLITGAGMAGGWSVSDYINIKGGANYYFQPNTTAGTTAKGCYYDSEKNFISSFNSGAIALTSPSNACFVRFSFRSASTDIQLELGTTATTYEAYKGETYTIDLGQTVYSGSLNLVSGVLTITHRFQALDALTWAKNGSTITFYSETLTGLQGETDDFYCSCYLPTINGGYNGQNGKMSIKTSADTSRIWVADNSYSTSADFKNSLTGQTAVLKLSTPIEVQLTPEEVRTFLGANNFFNDCGGDTEVEYRADMNLLIAELEGNRGLQMMRAIPTEENDEQEATQNEDER